MIIRKFVIAQNAEEAEISALKNIDTYDTYDEAEKDLSVPYWVRLKGVIFFTEVKVTASSVLKTFICPPTGVIFNNS